MGRESSREKYLFRVLSQMKQFLKKILSALASLKLGLTLLIALCVLMATGTILEKQHGALYAQWLVYDSPVFVCLIALLTANILASALVRLPFQKRLAGFYIIHLGILTLLAGAGVSNLWGYEGEMELVPNQTADTITSKNPALFVYFLESNDDDVIQLELPLPKKIYGLKASTSNFLRVGDAQINITDFIPFANPHNIEQTELPAADAPHVMSAHILVSRVVDNSVIKDNWLTNAHPAHIALSDTEMCVVVLGNLEHELPFEVILNKFEMGVDPSTSEPTSYTSFITVRDDVNTEDTIISMNHPLKKEGLRFYQSSFFELDDGQYGSVLSVNFDPGRTTKYTGSSLIVAGGLMHIFLRRRKK